MKQVADGIILAKQVGQSVVVDRRLSTLKFVVRPSDSEVSEWFVLFDIFFFSGGPTAVFITTGFGHVSFSDFF